MWESAYGAYCWYLLMQKKHRREKQFYGLAVMCIELLPQTWFSVTWNSRHLWNHEGNMEPSILLCQTWELCGKVIWVWGIDRNEYWLLPITILDIMFVTISGSTWPVWNFTMCLIIVWWHMITTTKVFCLWRRMNRLKQYEDIPLGCGKLRWPFWKTLTHLIDLMFNQISWQ